MEKTIKVINGRKMVKEKQSVVKCPVCGNNVSVYSTYDSVEKSWYSDSPHFLWVVHCENCNKSSEEFVPSESPVDELEKDVKTLIKNWTD